MVLGRGNQHPLVGAADVCLVILWACARLFMFLFCVWVLTCSVRRVYSYNKIGAEGARALADALTRNTALTTLHLEFVFAAHLCVPDVIVGRKKRDVGGRACSGV